MLSLKANMNLKVAKKLKKIKNPKKVVKKEIIEDENKFNFDDEIIIGVTRIPDKNNVKSKKSNVKKRKKKNIKPNNKKVIIEDEEINEEVIENKKRKIRIIKYTSIATMILIAIVATMFSPLFNVKEIKVIGNEKISENEIISLSQIEKEENTFKINKISATKNIKQNAYIESVQIKRNLPSEIEIIVEERKASFMLEYGGNYVYINNQGYILEISSEKLNLPIIQGQATEDTDFIAGNRLINEDLQKLSTVLKIMEQAKNIEISELITKIDVSNKEDYKIVLDSEKKTIYLGDCTNLNTRMLNVKVILEKEKGIEGDIFVDMDLNNSYPTFRQKV